MFRLIEDELRRYPNSCFAENVKSWYNALYSALSDDQSCSYQSGHNPDLCETQTPTTNEDVVEILNIYVSDLTSSEAIQTIEEICREAVRQQGGRGRP